MDRWLIICHEQMNLWGTERETGMPQVAEDRTDQDNHRRRNLRRHPYYFHKNGQQDQT